MQVLENERFRVEINEFGAELTRFTSKKGRHGVRLEGRSGGMETPCAHSVPDRGTSQG